MSFSAYLCILISLFVFKAPKGKLVRKRKAALSSGPGNSSGTANTTGPPASSPSTPSTQTPGEMITASTLQQNAPSSKSSQNQLVRDSSFFFF